MNPSGHLRDLALPMVQSGRMLLQEDWGALGEGCGSPVGSSLPLRQLRARQLAGRLQEGLRWSASEASAMPACSMARF